MIRAAVTLKKNVKSPTKKISYYNSSRCVLSGASLTRRTTFNIGLDFQMQEDKAINSNSNSYKSTIPDVDEFSDLWVQTDWKGANLVTSYQGDLRPGLF